MNLDEHLAGIVARDEEAFARWMAGAEHVIRARLRSFAAQIDVEAVLQETLMKAWEVAPRVEQDGKPNSLLRLSFRIARNAAISEVRRLRVRPVVTGEFEDQLDAASDGEMPATPDPLLRRVIEMCRDKLPPKPRKVFDLRLSSRGGDSDKTLAAQIDMAANTFLQNFTRARKLLAQCLAQNGVELQGDAK